jgi:ubiquinone/menaquinone biosynthesis C-methylase UbiE
MLHRRTQPHRVCGSERTAHDEPDAQIGDCRASRMWMARCGSGDQAAVVPDRVFDEPRLAGMYDQLDPDRSDLVVYASIARELGSRSVVDIGCGTGSFACLLAEEGLDVIGVDPAAAMLAVARGKPGAERVRWVHGVASDLPPVEVDLATMTANVAQVFLEDGEWAETLRAAQRVLRSGGWLVFESRRPEREAWIGWNPEDSFQSVDIAGLGVVESWYEVLDVSLPFVTFRGTIVFTDDGSKLTSDSTLRFRSRDEIATSLEATGFRVDDVREAPDRPGNEYVFLAERL